MSTHNSPKSLTTILVLLLIRTARNHVEGPTKHNFQLQNQALSPQEAKTGG